MRALWTTDAEVDRRNVREYIFPYMGHVGKIPGTRELIPHESYRLVYEIEGDTVLILALVHTARKWPPDNEE